MMNLWNTRGGASAALIEQLKAMSGAMHGPNHSAAQYPSSVLNQLMQAETLNQQGLLAALQSQANQNILAAASISDPELMRLRHALAASNGVLLSQRKQESVLCQQHTSSAPAASGNQSLLAELKQPASPPEPEEPFRLPCQARGMPMEHDSSTAYFEITPLTCHGQRLRCSFDACREAGVKFRYCFFCKKPVTKQNFRARHLHANLSNPANPLTASRDERRASNSSDAMLKSHLIPHEISERFERAPTIASSNKRSLSSLDAVSERQDALRSEQKLTMASSGPMVHNLNTVIPPSFSKSADSGGATTNTCNNAEALVHAINQRRRWTSLLQERPAGFRNLDVWLSEVLSVSDKSATCTARECPLSLRITPNGRKPSIEQRSRWNALLEERPMGDDHSRINSWLTKVLKVSGSKFDDEQSEKMQAKTQSKSVTVGNRDMEKSVVGKKESLRPSKKMKRS